MTEKEMKCSTCSKVFKVQVYSAGLSDIEAFTCDRDSTVLTVSAYDKRLYEVLGEHPRTAWSDDHFKKIEAQFIPCPCGGRFRHNVTPRCTNCGADLDIKGLAQSEFIVVGRLIQGEKQNPWLRPAE